VGCKLLMVCGIKVTCGDDNVGIHVIAVFMYVSVCFHFYTLL